MGGQTNGLYCDELLSIYILTSCTVVSRPAAQKVSCDKAAFEATRTNVAQFVRWLLWSVNRLPSVLWQGNWPRVRVEKGVLIISVRKLKVTHVLENKVSSVAKWYIKIKLSWWQGAPYNLYQIIVRQINFNPWSNILTRYVEIRTSVTYSLSNAKNMKDSKSKIVVTCI